MAPKKKDQKNENKSVPKKITIKKKPIQKSENAPKRVTIKKTLSSKKSVNKEQKNKPKVFKEKLVPYKSIKEEFPLIEPAFWVLQNNKRFPAWINKTFIKYKLTDKTKIKSIDGKFKPFPYQLFLRDYMQNASPYRGILLMHGLGSGKCFEQDTPVLMASGEIKMVQDVKIGDQVMGDDSTPRNVLTTTTGRDQMYDVIPIKGEKYRVNSEHILCLKYSTKGSISVRKTQKNVPYCVTYFNKNSLTNNAKSFKTREEAEEFKSKITDEDIIIDIPIKKYLKLSLGIKAQLKGYRTGVEFQSKEVDFDPYIIGLWLGDGSKRNPVITNQDSSVLLYLKNKLPEYDMMLNHQSKYTYSITATNLRNENKMLQILRKHNLINNKHIPELYKINNRSVRMQLLAGLIDSDGYFKKSATYEITQKNKKLSDDILFLCRSLGFGAYQKECKKSCMYKGEKREGTYYRIHFSGIGLEEIPVKIERKKAQPRKQIKNVLLTGITVQPSGEDNYYGFSVDGNHRFLLGDFTVTHNSCSAITIAENLKTDKNIVAIMPASLKGNFIGTEKEGLLFCGDPKYKSNPKLIDEHYTFISSNASNTIQQLNSVELDNHLIIIDEAHNLVSRMFGGLAGDNKQGRAIYNKLMDAKDCKIVALTGTPVVNDIYEAGILMNILHGYMYLTVFDIVYVSPKYGANWNLRQLEEELEKKEYVDYVQINKANKTIEFHLNIKPWHEKYREKLSEITDIAKRMEINIQYNTYMQFTLFPDEPEKGVEEFNKYFIDQDGSSMKNVELFKRRIMGLVSYYKGKQGNLPAIKTDEYVEVNMSPYQFSEYEKVRGEEKTSRKLSEIRVFTRQYSNFVFPGDIPRPGIGERVSKKGNSGNSANMQNESIAKVMKAGENDEDASEVKREELKRYQKAVDMALNALSANADKYLVKDKLGTYSNKMKAMLENIEKTNGLIFVYSDFRSLEGVEIFSRVLNANGYAKYGEDNKLPKYAMYTGSEDLDERNKIKKIFSSPENKYGRDIKIILATSAGAEGLDLKNIRQVHIMEPYWNNVRIKQVIGRAVRRNSHIELPPNERDVSIYRYMSLISPEDQKDLKPKERLSADQIILEIAKRKEKITNEMIDAMKGGAVDCVLNAIDNEGNISCMSFGESVDGISYVPRIGKDLGRGTESEMRKVEQKLRHGAIDIDGIVYFIEGKKLYKVSDKLKRNPITKIP